MLLVDVATAVSFFKLLRSTAPMSTVMEVLLEDRELLYAVRVKALRGPEVFLLLCRVMAAVRRDWRLTVSLNRRTS